MQQQPVRKLNKRLIYWCLVGLIALSMPAIFSLASSNKASRPAEHKPHEAHVNLYAMDAKAITGTEHFPETYSDVREFEKELTKNSKPPEPMINALAEIETKDRPQYPSLSFSDRADDPWLEANKREQKKRAFDHYDAKRSDIMFVNNVRNQEKNANGEDEILKMVDRVLEEQPSDPNDILLVKPGENKRFSSSKQGIVGTIKNPSPYMVSEGTLIHAILLSEINTDLPGPILARVSHNIWDSKTGQTLLIPQNSKLIGEYNSTVGHGQNRAQIVWTRIIYPNQQSVDLGSMVGVDKKATSGSAGVIDNHYDKVAVALLMTTALSASVRMTQGKYDPNSSSVGEDLGHAAAQETARLGSRITDKMLSIKPTITVPMGERLNIFVEQDLHLMPYSG